MTLKVGERYYANWGCNNHWLGVEAIKVFTSQPGGIVTYRVFDHKWLPRCFWRFCPQRDEDAARFVRRIDEAKEPETPPIPPHKNVDSVEVKYL